MLIDDIQHVELQLSYLKINTGDVLSSNSDKNTSSLQVTDFTELISHIYKLELNDGIVSTLTNNDKLNKVDNNTDTREEQTNEDAAILSSEPQAIGEPCAITGEKIN